MCLDRIKSNWKSIYGEKENNVLEEFLNYLIEFKKDNNIEVLNENWYKDSVVYSLYVDKFNNNFKGLSEKLGYFEDLGINCIWMLPILDSPMRDDGFDISDYKKIRAELFSEDINETEFSDFIKKAHSKNIKVIFDIALNHTSDEHYWFKESSSSANNKYRDYYIWSKTKSKYKDADIIFEGNEKSNWEKYGDEYYFHRFYNFQPDLNYRNPEVLIEMAKITLYWVSKGVDGFRFDAIPYIWKAEGTNCESLPQAHSIIKIFRSVLDYVRENTLILAEANQNPEDIVKYFGEGDECHAAYHFPLMQQIFKSIATKSNEPIREALKFDYIHEIPSNTAWFTFLRSHDEFGMEPDYMNEKDKSNLLNTFLKKEIWNFKNKKGISSRLSEMLDEDPKKINLSFSILLSLFGTPVIYYGDEFGMLNDYENYKKSIKRTGKKDSRHLVRGKINWNLIEGKLIDPKSDNFKVFSKVKLMLHYRAKVKSLKRGEINFINIYKLNGEEAQNILAYTRTYENKTTLIINNLSDQEIITDFNTKLKNDLLGNYIETINSSLILMPYEFYWLEYNELKY